MFTRYLLPASAVVLLLFAVLHVLKAQKPEPPLAPPAQPPQNPFTDSVAGTGLVEPQTENISVGSQIPGVVTDVFVRVNQKVRAGDPLFQLDDRELQAQLKLKNAELAQAQAQLARLKSMPRKEDLPVAKAKVAEAAANLLDKQLLRDRAISLRETNAISQEELSSRQQAYFVAEAQHQYAQAQYDLLTAGAWKSDVAVAEQAVTQAQVQVEQVRTDLDRLVVRALVDGEVLQVNVRKGEYVGALPGQAFIVLGNIEKLHVRVSIDEYDIPRYRPGSPAKAMLKGRPEPSFPLTFVRVEPFVIPKKSLTGENTERVDTRVLQVIYEIGRTSERLYVGQQLDVFIDIGSPAAQ